MTDPIPDDHEDESHNSNNNKQPSPATTTTTTATAVATAAEGAATRRSPQQPSEKADVTMKDAVDGHGDDDDEEEEDYRDGDDDEEDDDGGGAPQPDHPQQQPQQQPPQPPAAKRVRRSVQGDKADLYSHFTTLDEKAYTKGGKDLGLYLCVCRYCQAAYEEALRAYRRRQGQQRSSPSSSSSPHPPPSPPAAPQPFPRTRRYCVNHQKACQNVPSTVASAVTAASMVAGHRTRTSGVFTSTNANNAPSSSSPTTDHITTTTGRPTTLMTSTRGGGGTTTRRYHHNHDQEDPGDDDGSIRPSTFEVYVAKDTFKFNAAHFVAFRGYRERLHGHNYAVAVRLQGSATVIGPDGYVIDYGNVKVVCRAVCKELNERFLCPLHSDVLRVSYPTPETLRLDCLDEEDDGTHFVFPAADCKVLPIVHATTEELAVYLWSRVMEGLDAGYLRARGIRSMEITVAEAPGQQATFRHVVTGDPLDVRTFVRGGGGGHVMSPAPCLDDNDNTNRKKRPAATAASRSSCGPDCPGCGDDAAASPAVLRSLTDAMRAQGLLTRDVTTQELQSLLQHHQQEQQQQPPPPQQQQQEKNTTQGTGGSIHV